MLPNAAHIHLITNHIPVVGIILCTGILLYGLLAQKEEVTRLALWLVVVITIVGNIAFFSGDAAADIVKQLPGISKDLIHDHEEVAEIAFTLLEILGGAALLTLLIWRRRPYLPRPAAWTCLALALATCGAMGLAANQGGQIHHPEIQQ